MRPDEQVPCRRARFPARWLADDLPENCVCRELALAATDAYRFLFVGSRKRLGNGDLVV